MTERFRADFGKAMLIALGVLIAAGMFGIMASVANAAPGTNPYPFAKSSHWAWQNRPDLPGTLGEPKDWDNNAIAHGWPVGPLPRKGDIAVFEPGIWGADPVVGHVAVVEQVYEDGTYLTSQMDEADCKYESATCGSVNRRVYPVARGISFIHTMKDTRTTWGFAGGASGWTAFDMGPGNMGGPGWYYPLAGSDPRLISGDLDVPLGAYNAVEIDMVTGAQVKDPGIQVYFATATHPGFTEAQSLTLKGLADGQVRTYRAYFGGNPAWKGSLTKLRLDPSGAGTQGGVRIDRVRLVKINRNSEDFSALSGTPAKPSNAGRDRARR